MGLGCVCGHSVRVSVHLCASLWGSWDRVGREGSGCAAQAEAVSGCPSGPGGSGFFDRDVVRTHLHWDLVYWSMGKTVTLKRH